MNNLSESFTNTLSSVCIVSLSFSSFFVNVKFRKCAAKFWYSKILFELVKILKSVVDLSKIKSFYDINCYILLWDIQQGHLSINIILSGQTCHPILFLILTADS